MNIIFFLLLTQYITKTFLDFRHAKSPPNMNDNGSRRVNHLEEQEQIRAQRSSNYMNMMDPYFHPKIEINDESNQSSHQNKQNFFTPQSRSVGTENRNQNTQEFFVENEEVNKFTHTLPLSVHQKYQTILNQYTNGSSK